MTGSAILVGVFVVSALTAGQDVHFDLIDGDCSDNSTVVTECNAMYNKLVTEAFQQDNYTEQMDCILMTETIACVETALCHCDFSPDHVELQNGYRSTMTLYHFFNNLTQCANVTYGDNILPDVTWPLDVTRGVNCSRYNRTAGDLSLSLAVAQIPAVQEVDSLCPGVRQCYILYDTNLAEALYRKHWPDYCRVSMELLQCLVNVTCTCRKSTHDLVVQMIEAEKDIYKDSCDSIFHIETTRELHLFCQEINVCEADNPDHNCQTEYEAASNAASSRGQFCRAVYDLANCTEALACECGFYQQPGYYRSLAIAKHRYVVNYGCELETGVFPNHTGLACGTDDRFTEQEKILSISLAEPSFVEGEEASCPGIKSCFDIANVKSSEAHRMKDLTLICQTELERIQCVEQAYCACGRLHEEEVNIRMSDERLNHATLCYIATEFVPLTRCRGVSTCQQSDPLNVCLAEYNFDAEMAAQSYVRHCQAIKNHITCTEEVGCACGLLDDGTSLAAEAVYNTSTLMRKNYNDVKCPAVTGELMSQTEGIQCADQPDDATKRRLVLSYADSSEVAALAAQCQQVRGCFQTNDQTKGQALWNRDFNQLCQVQLSLIHCVDKAYCQCGMNGTQTAETYVDIQVRTHKELCTQTVNVDRKTCERVTASAGRVSLTLSLLLVLLLMSSNVRS